MLFNQGYQGCVLLPSLALSPYWTRLHHGWVRLDRAGQVASSMDHPSFSPGTMVATGVHHGLSHVDSCSVSTCFLYGSARKSAIALLWQPWGLILTDYVKARHKARHSSMVATLRCQRELAFQGLQQRGPSAIGISSLLGSAYPQCTNIFSQRTAGGATPDHCLKFSVQSTS